MPFLRIFQWWGQLQKGTSGIKGKVEKYTLLGGLRLELPRLDFLQFQHDFRSFPDKQGLLMGRGQNPSVGDGGGGDNMQHRDWGGGFGPSSMYVKKGSGMTDVIGPVVPVCNIC